MASKSANISQKNGSTFECKPDNHIPLVGPSVQATKHQTEALEYWKQTRIVGDHVFKVDTPVPKMASTIHGHGDLQVRQTYHLLACTYHRQHFFLPHILQQNILQPEQRQSTNFALIFRKTRIVKYADARKPGKKNPDDRTDRKNAGRFGDMITADNNVLNAEQESWLHHSNAVVVQDLATSQITLTAPCLKCPLFHQFCH